MLAPSSNVTFRVTDVLSSARKGPQKVSDLLLMSQREVSRLNVLQQLSSKRLKQRQAGELLGLSTRQIIRLAKAYHRSGAALVSKRRGLASNNRLPAQLHSQACELRHTRYSDFGPTLAHEKLRELHPQCSVWHRASRSSDVP